MKYKEISKQNSAAELERTLDGFRESLRRFRFAVSQGKTKGVKAGRETRKDIARVLTRLSQKGFSNGIKRT